MLTRIRTQLKTLAIVVAAAVLCELVAHSTEHKHGLARAVSWIGFIGFWIAVVAFLALLVLIPVTAVRTRRAVRP